MKKSIIFLILSLFFSLSDGLFAQPDTTFSSPYSAIYNHLHFLQTESYEPEKSAKSFDPGIPASESISLAIQLKQILDGRGLFVHLSKIPENPDYTDTLSEKKVFYPFPSQLPEVYVEKKLGRWQYGSETVKAIPGLHSKTYPLGTEYLLQWQAGKTGGNFLGLNTWQYVGILILMVISILVFLLLRLILRPILRKIGKVSFHAELGDRKLLNRTSHVLSLLFVFLLVRSVFPVLQLPVKWTLVTRTGLNIIITVFVALVILRILDYIMTYFKGIAERTESKMDDQLLPIVGQIFKLIIFIGAAIQILHLLHVNVTALIAGISIGGLALALAAKDTVGNLIGSLMIFIDKPFQIGDFIEVGGQFGTVVEVGFRTTRIQTIDSSVISIPNGSIANTTLMNMGIRVYRLLDTKISITYDTPPELIEVYVAGLRELVRRHPKTLEEKSLIFLNGLANSSLDIFFRVYLRAATYDEELAIREDILLHAIRLAQRLGVRFAFPSTSLYVEQFPGQKSLIPEYTDKKENWEEKVAGFFRDYPLLTEDGSPDQSV